MNNLIEQIRHAQVLAAEQVVVRSLVSLGLSKPVESPKTNSALELCKLVEPYLVDGQRLFASKSIVVAVNDSQPLADRLADIELTIRLLTVLAGKLRSMEI